MTMTEKTPPQAPASRDGDHWAKPVDRLSADGVEGANVDGVTGRRVTGPLQGFGQLWQKTLRVPLDGSSMSPQQVIAAWKEQFATFWPKNARFYAPLAGIAPGEVALMDLSITAGSPIKLSTGIMVLYADEESFTFTTPEGHALSAWITFSAYRDGDVTIAQIQALERTSDPIDELAYVLGANRMNDRFWRDTLANVGRAMGVTHPAVEVVVVCIDPRRQWRRAANIRNSATLRMARQTVTAPARWFTRRR